MYCDFFQMRERPFNVTADPKFLYLNARYREALASLHYGITQRKGFVTLIGEAGTGKTTLLKKLLDELDQSTRTVFVFNTNVTFDEILEYIFGEFDLPVHNGKRLYMLQRLNTFLLEELGKGRNVALLIDEAQDLDYSVLEDLRLLSNLETAKEKILQIVLSGQPELGQKLGNPGLRQLRQRIAVNCRLLPLTREELTEYIQSRLTAAGAADPKLFARDAEERIFEISTGIPRLVNIVCDNALVIGYALGKKRIGADVVNEAAADLLTADVRGEPVAELRDEPPPPITVAAPSRSRRLSQVGAIAVVVVALVIGLLSVGRSLLRRDPGTLDRLATQRVPLEVVQPGLRELPEPRMARPFGTEEARGREVTGTADPRAPEAPGSGAAVASAALPGAFAPTDTDPEQDGMRPPVGVRPIGPVVARPSGPPLEVAPVVASAEQEAGRSADAPDAVAHPVVAAVPPAAQAADIPSGIVVVPAADDAPVAGSVRDAMASVSARAAPVPEPAPVPEQVAAVGRPAVLPEAAPDTADNVTLALPSTRRLQVKPGDSISQITTRTYGQASATMLDLMKLANPSIRDIDVISVGQELRLPQLDQGLALLQEADGDYALLVLSTPVEARAREIGRTLRQHGFEARVGRAAFGAGRVVWRVIIGDLNDRASAQAVGRQLQQVVRNDARIAALAERLETSER